MWRKFQRVRNLENWIERVEYGGGGYNINEWNMESVEGVMVAIMVGGGRKEYRNIGI
jgi:hypothetical protein